MASVNRNTLEKSTKCWAEFVFCDITRSFNADS